MEQTKWNDISNAFNPREPVPPDKVDEWFVSRPDKPLKSLVNKLSPALFSDRYIIVGQPSNGKSSELTKLAAELKNRYKDTLVVRFDIAEITDISQANPVEVIYLMGASVFKAANYELQKKPDMQLLKNLTKALETIVQNYTANTDFEIDLTKLLKGLIVYGAELIGMPDEVTSVFKGYFRFTSGIDMKKLRTREIDPTVEPMLQSLNAILEDIRNKSGGNPPVLLVDGLDKLRDTDAIKLMFVEKQFLKRPICNVVYIGPLDLYYFAKSSQGGSSNRIIPHANIKIFKIDHFDKLDENGRKVMTEVISTRLKTLKLTIAEVITDDALEMLIRGSGGVMRDFVRLIQNAAIYAEINKNERITSQEAKKVLNELRRQLSAQITPKYELILEKVKESHKRTDDEECDVLLRNNIVLSYVNDDIWFHIHSGLSEKPW